MQYGEEQNMTGTNGLIVRYFWKDAFDYGFW